MARNYKKNRKRRMRKNKLYKPVPTGHVSTKLSLVVTATSDGSGIIDDVFNMGRPNVSVDGVNAYQDWSSFSALYDQYRVRAFKLEYFPSLPNDTSTTTGYRPIFLAYDRDSETAITGLTDAATITGRRIKNMYQSWNCYWKLSKGSSSAPLTGGWKDCAVPLGTGAVKSYCNGLDASTTYGIFVLTCYVQFKNRI